MRAGSVFQKPAVRFLLCGGLAAFINWAARFPLSLVLPFWLAVLAALAIGMVCGFYLYRAWVWPRSDAPLHVLAGRFVAVNLVNAVAILAITGLAAEALRVQAADPALAEAAAHAFGIAAGAVLNYFAHARFTFA